MKTLKEIKNMKKKKGNTTMKKYIAILMAIASGALPAADRLRTEQ